MVAGSQRVVAVDDGDGALIGVGELCGDGVRLNSLNVVAVVVHDVQRGHALGSGGVLRQVDQALLLQQQQRAGLVGVVRRDDDGRAVLQLGQVGNALAVDAERLIVDRRGDCQMRAVCLVEAVEIRGVLEVVRVQLAAFQRLVRQNVIVKHHDLQLPALGGEGVLHLLEDLGVRGGACADGDDLVGGVGAFSGGFGVGSGGLGGCGVGSGGLGAGLGIGGLACAAGQCKQAQSQSQSEQNGYKLFHGDFSFLRYFACGFLWSICFYGKGFAGKTK